ncbi:hypothetical protein JFU48_22445 [Pseudomonas sp. TH49]|uniref:hypothetical protein n=1 Tax=unclassified Pseudomonas TaxID=196821 RepID=UPI00191293D6|nr:MULTISPECIES: hypothetical protein [unclassified Pseudomonas]MBK5344139.1 hypothetical protein [Pseudomonas sp. TH49]MCU1771499.1 hypothetical protein [Pseudomonas sp. 13B_3.2_Bac1]
MVAIDGVNSKPSTTAPQFHEHQAEAANGRFALHDVRLTVNGFDVCFNKTVYQEYKKVKREGVIYSLHHVGIPTDKMREGERYAARVGMWTSDDLTGPLPVQWHRFTDDSPLHHLLKTVPHVAYRVSNLDLAVAGHTLILGPYEPIDDYKVAVIDNSGVPVELIETSLTDDQIWNRARNGTQSSLYAKD